MSSSYKRNGSHQSRNDYYDDYHTPNKRNDRSPYRGSTSKKSRGYIGRENSPHKKYHDDHLCKICECVAPNAKHTCPPKKDRYPKNLKSTMRNDYDRVRGWINPNDPPNSHVPHDNYNKSRPLRDNYDTIYKKDYIGSAPAKPQSFKPEQRHIETAPFFANTTYKDMTRSSKKPGYSPLKKKSRKAKPTSNFDERTIYQKDYKGKEPNPAYRDEMGSTNKEIFGGTTNHRGTGPMKNKTVYKDDYRGHEPDPNNVYVVDPFMETSLPKPKHMIDKSVYMNDYIPKKKKNRKCPLYDMPNVPDDVRNEGGHIYFDADYEEWYNQRDKQSNHRY